MTEHDHDEKKPYKPDPRQLSFDFDKDVRSRHKRILWISQIILPGRKAGRMKFLLRVIEGHDRDNIGCKLKIETIGKEMGCLRTAKRALKDCVAAGLLYYEGKRSPLKASFFAIRYDVIAQKIVDDPKTIHVIVPPTRRFTSDTCAGSQVTLVQSTSDTCAVSQVTLGESTSDTCAGSEGGSDHIHRARVLKPSLSHEEKPEETKPDFPVELNSPEFRDAWEKWRRHLIERGKVLSSVATEQQLANLAAMGLGRAVSALEHSLGNGWVTIYEPPSARRETSNQPGPNQPGPGQKYDPSAVVGEF